MADQPKTHILLFPFMAQGHMIPFLALALHLENKTRTQKTHSISLINTPKNIQTLKSLLPPDSSIKLIEIPFKSSDHGLPPETENCDSLPYDLVINLIQASSSFENDFKNIALSFSEPVVCVIGDMFFGWAARACKEIGVFHAVFSGSGGFGLGCYYSAWVNLPHKNSPPTGEDDFVLPDFAEAKKIHKTQLPMNLIEATGSDPWSVFSSKNYSDWRFSDGILINTVEELDGIGLDYFKRKLELPVYAIGPMLLSREIRAKTIDKTRTESLLQWLDSKPQNSVLYISFGSMNTISQTHMTELALALEASDKNFIWVVRPPLGFDINESFNPKKWLPEGFEERIRSSGKGFLIPKWAPQIEILKHKSVSVFLSHCGWNSVLESLSYGVPLLGWAMAGEQFFNVKLLVEEVRVCVEVARGKRCEIKHEEIVEKIELVMGDTVQGKEMRSKSVEMREMIKSCVRDEDDFKGSSVKAINEFLYAASSSMKKTTNNFHRN